MEHLWNTISSGEHALRESAQNNKLLGKLLCGATAGVAAKTAIAPIERVKMTFQLSSEKFSLTSCCNKLAHTVRTEGVTKLWRGHSANIARVAPYAALHYSIHDYVESFMQHLQSPALSGNKMLIQFVAGSLAGGGATLVTYPLDVMRVRIAFGPRGLSLVQSWRAAFQHGSIWQGFVPTMLGVIPYSGTAWCAKSIFQNRYAKLVNRTADTSERLIINACAGLVGQLVTYPLDVVRRRMQMVNIVHISSTAKAASSNGSSGSNIIHGVSNAAVAVSNKTTMAATAAAVAPSAATAAAVAPSAGRFENMRETMNRLYRTEGVRGLTKGFSLNVFKGPITLSISLTVYDLTQEWLKKGL